MKTVDPVAIEIVRSSLDTAADEMVIILMRTAHSAIVRESMDFSTALCDAEGRTVAQGLTTPMHLGSFYDAMRHLIAQYESRIGPGDVFIGNDPYVASGQHLPDIYVIKPIFSDAALIGWATTIAHHADVGGIVPGSNAIGATEIYQEGLRLPFLKLYEAGEANQAIFDIIATNVRVPQEVVGDIHAQLAACTAGERAYRDVFRRHGPERFPLYVEALHDIAERLARAAISEIPDGVYRFESYIDGLGEDPQPIILRTAVEVTGDTVRVDWEGTSKQVSGGINAPLSFTKSNVYAALRSVMPVDMPNAHGFTRPITVTAPVGSLLNAVHPAPCGARGITGYRVADCMFGALAQAVPEKVTADGAGGSTLPTFGGWQDGKPFVFSECVMGTWGAAFDHDGQEGVPHICSNQSNVPIEFIETDYPLRIERYGFVPDTGGAGRYRGGLSIEREYRLLCDEAILSVRADKSRFRPFGLFGGKAGAPASSVIDPDGAACALPILMTKPRLMSRNEVFRHVLAGGGGFGDPLERDPALVLSDMLDGKITAKHARAAYGVVAVEDADGWRIDAAETARVRAEMAGAGRDAR